MRLEGKDLLAAELLDNFIEGGGTLDGFDVQEMLVRAGMLVATPVAPDCPEEDRCSNCDGDCDECFRLTPEAKALHDVFEIESGRIGGIVTL